MPNAIDRRSEVLKGLQRETVRIPDLEPIFTGWPGIASRAVNPYREQLTFAVNERLDHLREIGAIRTSSLKLLKNVDFALFTAQWWPRTNFEKSCTLAYLVIWLFTWDDEIDQPDGFCSENLKAAERYRTDTLHVVQRSLNLCSDGNAIQTTSRECPHPIIESFLEIGGALREAYTLDQREYFYKEIVRFIQMSEREQRIRLTNKIPSMNDYWQFRMGTSAVYISLAACEFATGSQLPSTVLRSPTMQQIWDETNLIISITNDLLSLKKEIKRGCIDSAVPLLCASGLDVRPAIEQTVQQLLASKERFDAAASALLQESMSLDAAGSSQQVVCFIDVCRTNCTGNLLWSLITPRYGLLEQDVHREDGGSLSFELETTTAQARL